MGGRTYRPNSSVSCPRPPPSFPFDSASVGVGSATTLARCLRTASTSPGRMGSLRWCLGGISQTPITQESRLSAQVFTKKGRFGIRDRSTPSGRPGLQHCESHLQQPVELPQHHTRPGRGGRLRQVAHHPRRHPVTPARGQAAAWSQKRSTVTACLGQRRCCGAVRMRSASQSKRKEAGPPTYQAPAPALW